MTSTTTERHEHKAPQCKTTKDEICKNESCVHDHHVSRHTEISCTPVKGQHDLYDCVHSGAK